MHSLSFSRHASARLQQRNINLSSQQIKRLEQAVENIRNKGGQLSLVLLEQLAMVVSIGQAKVITVVGREQLQQNVFTNIDSAVIA